MLKQTEKSRINEPMDTIPNGGNEAGGKKEIITLSERTPFLPVANNLSANVA